ncbi:hypothetical protein JQC91_02055 [Jannaschia sp. Os4]|uniref:hypothetical protein n=1 Tax=Jannaschia sp. Os4 TaxID=2807617 RepID=UPI0019396D9B|nr:hypothetical protein [Jannaschia sp. Os4]MBM2575077.1 hypothetical protein [Jannaschia sp. Os4]
MTIDRRSLLALLGASIAAPARGQDREDPFEGGIGGTGIVGTLTALGSIRVNGLRLGFAQGLRVRTAYGDVAPSALAQGMSLSARAVRAADGTYATRDVSIDWQLVGTVRELRGGRFTVNGSPVRAERGALGRPVEGERAAVSGVWEGGTLVASRVEPAPHPLDLVAGTAGDGRIGGAPIDARVDPGSYVTALGRGEDGGLRVERADVGRAAFAAGIGALAVEGYLDRIAAAPGFRLSGLGHRFAPDLSLAPLAGRRAVYAGPYDGRFSARAGYVLPEGLGARRLALAGGIGPGFGGRVVRTRD